MKLQNLILGSIFFTITSCKLLTCAAKADKYLPEEETKEVKNKIPLDTAALILQCCVAADSLQNPKEAMPGGTTYYFTDAKVQPNWKYKSDTIIATLLKSGEARAAIPGYPKKIVNEPFNYTLHKNTNGIYEAKSTTVAGGVTIVNQFTQ